MSRSVLYKRGHNIEPKGYFIVEISKDKRSLFIAAFNSYGPESYLMTLKDNIAELTNIANVAFCVVDAEACRASTSSIMLKLLPVDGHTFGASILKDKFQTPFGRMSKSLVPQIPRGSTSISGPEFRSNLGVTRMTKLGLAMT